MNDSRTYLRAFRSVALVLVAFFTGIAFAADRVAPNIIVILADDLGYGDLSCYGQSHFTTPRLDRMAAEGLRFTQAYAGAPVCAPSRCSLLTGLHTGHTRVRANSDTEVNHLSLHPEDVTIAEVLHGAGYATACIGKWGLGDAGTTGTPEKQGFDHFYGFLDQQTAHVHYPSALWRDGHSIAIAGNDPEKQTGTPSQTLFTEDALQYIRDKRSAPFFLLLSYTYPHAELSAPAEEVAAFSGRFGTETPHAKDDYAAQPEPRATFAAMMTMLDRDVGRVLDTLDELKIADNTLVLFMSDNGPTGLGGNDYQYFDSNGPLRGAKRSLYEGGIRVPLIARWPGAVAAGGICDVPVAAWDLLPTFRVLAKAAYAGKTDGLSIAPILLGDTQRQLKHPFFYWEFPGDNGRQAVRLGRWKGIRTNVVHAPHGQIQLYDLDTDPGETQDVSKEYLDVCAAIVKIMSDAHRPTRLSGF